MSLLLNEKIDDLSYHPWSFLKAPRVKKKKTPKVLKPRRSFSPTKPLNLKLNL